MDAIDGNNDRKRTLERDDDAFRRELLEKAATFWVTYYKKNEEHLYSFDLFCAENEEFVAPYDFYLSKTLVDEFIDKHLKIFCLDTPLDKQTINTAISSFLALVDARAEELEAKRAKLEEELEQAAQDEQAAEDGNVDPHDDPLYSTYHYARLVADHQRAERERQRNARVRDGRPRTQAARQVPPGGQRQNPGADQVHPGGQPQNQAVQQVHPGGQPQGQAIGQVNPAAPLQAQGDEQVHAVADPQPDVDGHVDAANVEVNYRIVHQSTASQQLEVANEHVLHLSNIPYLPRVDDKLREAVKAIWPTRKFIVEPPVTLARKEYKYRLNRFIGYYTERCLDHIANNNPDAYGHFANEFDLPPQQYLGMTEQQREMNWELRKCFVKQYGKRACKFLNEFRSSIQQVVTKLMREYYGRHGHLIDMSLVESCAKRTLDFTNPMHQHIWLWYYLYLIPAVATKEMFGFRINRFHLLSEAVLPENARHHRVPPSTEAMAVVLYRNHHKRVIDQEQWKIENPGKPLPRGWNALYVAETSGKQHILGGWHHKEGKPGIEKYLALHQECCDARLDRDNCFLWEDWARNQARLPHNNNGLQIQGNSYEQWTTIRRRCQPNT